MSVNILTRSGGLSSLSSPSTLSSQIDGLVSAFVEEAANPRTLAALTAGGFAYRLGRMGVMGLELGSSWNTPLRVGAIAGGLFSEVTAFEFTNRTLLTFLGEHRGSPLQDASRLWSWSGPGGWREGWLTSLITFGTLRGAGYLARGQNLAFQHLVQSTAMVSGHQAAGLLGFNRVPEGSFAEQLLHAEVMNLQLGAGMALAHRMAPGLHALERSLEISLSSREPGPRLNFLSPLLREPSLALAGEGRFSVPDDKPPVPENILMMSSKGGSDREITYTIEDYEALAQRAMSDEEVLDYLRILAESGDSNATQALALAAAEGNARAVFVLRDFVQEGDPAATILLRNLDIRHLVQLATHDPEATWALHYLEELKNIDAIQVMNGFDLVEENLDSPVGTNGNGLDLFEGEEDLWSSKPKDKKGPPN